MSRSHKKHPIHKDHSKDGKKFANKAVRQYLKHLEKGLCGKWYRKIFNSYNLTDWVYRATDEYWKIKFSRK